MLPTKFLAAVIGFFGLVIVGHLEASGADWKDYGKTDYGDCFYDAGSVTRLSENMIRVWTKTVYSKNDSIRMLIEHGEHYENVSYSVTLWVINCSEKMYHFLSVQDCSREGAVLFSEEVKKEWDFFAPGSIDETLYERICK
jgi:hypothetical protein